MKQEEWRGRGIGLLEMLIAIAVAGILAVLFVVAAGGLKKCAQIAAATSHLRQIGLATQTYASEHDGSLPGPTTVAIYRFAREVPEPNDVSHLGAYLAPYLGVTGFSDAVPVLSCPGMSPRILRATTVPNFVRIDYPAASPNNRFGAWMNHFEEEETSGPKKIFALTEEARRTPFVTTADKASWHSDDNELLPDEGVFDGKRAWLFLDGSVVINANPSTVWLR